MMAERPSLRREQDADAPRSLEEIIDEIVSVYHEPLRYELEQIHQLVLAAMATTDDSGFGHMADVAEIFGVMKHELEAHITKEEKIIFPWILRKRTVRTTDPVHALLDDHEAARRMLYRLRELTFNYTPPAGAGKAMVELWRALANLDRGLVEHMHIEDEELFVLVHEA